MCNHVNSNWQFFLPNFFCGGQVEHNGNNKGLDGAFICTPMGLSSWTHWWAITIGWNDFGIEYSSNHLVLWHNFILFFNMKICHEDYGYKTLDFLTQVTGIFISWPVVMGIFYTIGWWLVELAFFVFGFCFRIH